MAPESWSISYLLRDPLGISTTTSISIEADVRSVSGGEGPAHLVGDAPVVGAAPLRAEVEAAAVGGEGGPGDLRAGLVQDPEERCDPLAGRRDDDQLHVPAVL